MPPPVAVYVVTVIGVVAVGIAFKEFIYDPHIKPKLEARRRRNNPISVRFTSRRRPSSSGHDDNHNDNHGHNGVDSDDKAKLRDLRNMNDIGELKKEGLFEMETLSWRATSASASASGVDNGTLRQRNTAGTTTNNSNSTHRQLDDIFPPMIPSTTASEQVQSDTERTSSDIITPQPASIPLSVPPNDTINPFHDNNNVNHDSDVISSHSSSRPISPPVPVSIGGTGGIASESIVFRVESDDDEEEGSLVEVEADSRPISPFSVSELSESISGSFSQISSSTPSVRDGERERDGDGETHPQPQSPSQSQSQSLSMSQSFSNEYYHTPSQSAYLDFDNSLSPSSPPHSPRSPRSPSHDEWARIEDSDSDTDSDRESKSGSEEDWVSTGVLSDAGHR